LVVAAKLTESALKSAQENHDAISNKLKNTKASREVYEENQHLYEGRAKAGTFFLKIMNEVLDSKDSIMFWGGNVSIDTVRGQLGFHSWHDMKDLTREEVLACLHTMELKRYQDNDFFKGLWKVPPGGLTIEEWNVDNPSFEKLNTGKGSCLVPSLRKRLANYLGLSTPRSESPPPRMDASSLSLEELMHELAARKLAASREGTEEASRQATNDGEDDADGGEVATPHAAS
jgi:hypothetical protein